MAKLELLSPAGDMERLKMAVLYGADAVYLAGTTFGMRAFAGNFTPEELPQAVKFAHDHSVKAHVTVNIMPRNDEVAQLPAYLEQLDDAGVDALIVADLGAFNLAKKYAPHCQRHVSTQQSIANYECAQSWYDLGEIIAQGIVSREDYEQLEAYTRAIFQRGTEIAAKMGLILVDTKYEFGKKDGKIYLMDEIHTPDSSRYFYAEGYAERLAAGEKQKQLSKEFVREWLMANGFQGQEGQQVPEMTEDIVNGITERYVELYENIVGEKFEKAEGTDIIARIEKSVTECLESL